MQNNKAIVGIIAVIAIAIGIFVGRSIAYSRAESKKEYAVALKDYDLHLYKEPGNISFAKEIDKIHIKKDEKMLVVKKEYFGVSKKGKIRRDCKVTGTNNKKYQLKKDEVYEILGWSNYRTANSYHDYYLKLAQNEDSIISCEINGMGFFPLRLGEWWYIKTRDKKEGWIHPIVDYEKLLSEQINFISMSEAKPLGLDGKAYDLKTEDIEEVSIYADKQGNAKLINKKDNKELLVLKNFDNVNSPIDFSVRDIYTKDPEDHLWEVKASVGTHAKNCGYWIIGKNKGKWTVYVSDKELSQQGYTPKEWHRLSSKIEKGQLIITSSIEYMPPGAQFGYQRESINDMAFEAYWDFRSNMLKLRPWGKI